LKGLNGLYRMLSSPVFIYTGLSTLYLFVVGKGVEEVVYRCTTMIQKVQR
jgi:hypothetical protein